MKQKQFFIPILKDGWKITWRHKGWWLIGLLALFLTGSFGYQLVLQGVQSLANPDRLVLKWQQWSVLSQPLDIVKGQFEIFRSAPLDWLVLAGIWLVIGLVAVILFSISVYALTMIIAAVKNHVLTERLSFVVAFTESFLHFKSVFGAVLLLTVVTNVLMIIFSLPIVALGFGTGATSAAVLIVVFAIFLIVSFLISMVGLYTILAIVVDNLKVSPAIARGWKMLKNHLVVSVEMFLIQILIAIAAAVLLLFLVALLVIPAAIIGTLLVAGQQFDITAALPAAVLILLVAGALFIGAIYTLFQLASWVLLYMRIDKQGPYSRLAQFAELTLGVGVRK